MAKERAASKITRRNLLRYAGCGAALGIGFAAFGDDSAQWLELTRHELNLPNWGQDGFKIALLSDLHANYPDEAERASRALEMALAEKPDAVLMPGDFINERHSTAVRSLQQALRPLRKARCPVFASLGNHDYASGRTELIGQILRAHGVNVLTNEIAQLGDVSIAGLDDGLSGHPDVDFLMDGIHSSSLICMLHEPDYVYLQPEHVSLQVSGHSHGGQVCLPGGIPIHTPYGARKYTAGLYPDANVPLYVTRGVGTTEVPWRLFCRPEVSILTLRGA